MYVLNAYSGYFTNCVQFPEVATHSDYELNPVEFQSARQSENSQKGGVCPIQTTST